MVLAKGCDAALKGSGELLNDGWSVLRPSDMYDLKVCRLERLKHLSLSSWDLVNSSVPVFPVSVPQQQVVFNGAFRKE